MKWIKLSWDNLEVTGLCFSFFGFGLGFGLIFVEYVNIKFILVSATLLMMIGLCFALLGSKKAFDKYRREMK